MNANETIESYDNIPVIGNLPPKQMAKKLRRMGDSTTADEILRALTEKGKAQQLFGFGPVPAWKHTSHQYGFIPMLTTAASGPQAIQSAGVIEPHNDLKGSHVNIRLDRLRVYQYPGGGTHKILFTFKAQNQIVNAPEPVSFSQVYEVREGETAGVAGQPIFLGLNVGDLGANFEISTVNVRNGADQKILNILDCDPLKSGLSLLATAQPVLKPFTDITLGLAKMFAMRNDNVKVQQVFLGLDFTSAGLGLRLAEGEYIVVQVPSENTLNWNDWQFIPVMGSIVDNVNSNMLPYNYFIFRVSIT